MGGGEMRVRAIEKPESVNVTGCATGNITISHLNGARQVRKNKGPRAADEHAEMGKVYTGRLWYVDDYR